MNTETDRQYLQRLRALLGRDCTYLGKPCRIIDLLADEGMLILELVEPNPPIQVDQYGRPSHRYNEVMQVPIFGPDKEAFSEDVLDIFASLPQQDQDNR